MEQILKERGQFDLNIGFLMIYLMQMNYRVLINQLRHVLEYMVQIIKTILLPALGKNDRNFKKVFKLFLIHDNIMLAERAFYCLI